MSKKKLFSLMIVFLFLASCSSLNEWRISYFKKMDDSEIQEFMEGVRPNKDSISSYYKYACYLKDRNRYKAAIQEFEKVLALDPEHVKSLNWIGICHDRLGNHDTAITFYKRALEIDPELDYAYNNLGYSHLLNRDFESAINALKKAIELDDGNPQYHNNLGLAYFKTGSYSKSRDHVESGGGRENFHSTLARLDKMEKRKKDIKPADTPETPKQPTKLAKKEPEKNKKPEKVAGKTEKEPDEPTKAEKNAENKQEVSSGGRENFHSNPAGLDERQNRKKTGIKTTDTPETPKQPTKLAKKEPEKNKKPEKVAGKTEKKTAEPTNAEKTAGNKQDVSRDSAEPAKVEISNGNGVPKMASKVGEYLKAKDLSVTRLTNASHFGYPETKLFYCPGYLHEAYEVAQKIPGWQNMDRVEELGASGIKIRVLIGHDIVEHTDMFFKAEKKDDSGTRLAAAGRTYN